MVVTWLLKKLLNKLPQNVAKNSPLVYPHDAHAKRLRYALNHEQFEEIEEVLRSLPEDYRSFGLHILGEEIDEYSLEMWISHSNSNIVYLVKAHHLIEKAWEIRGGGLADTVSYSNTISFHDILEEVFTMLDAFECEDAMFEVERLNALLVIFRALPVAEDLVEEVFHKGVSISPHHFNLHVSYFTAISPKWGGSEQEVEEYLKKLPSSSNILSDMIWCQYYMDLLVFDEDSAKIRKMEIKEFIRRVKKEDSYLKSINRQELYDSMVFLSMVDSQATQQVFNDLLRECYGVKWYQDFEM